MHDDQCLICKLKGARMQIGGLPPSILGGGGGFGALPQEICVKCIGILKTIFYAFLSFIFHI